MYACMQDDAQLYGVDWNGPIPLDDDAEQVEVPFTDIPLSESDYSELVETISPQNEDGNYGIGVYSCVLSFVESRPHN